MGLFNIFKKKDPEFEKGVRLINEQKYSEAIEAFKNVQPESSYYEEALAKMISFLNVTEQYEEASQWFDKIPETSKHYQQSVSDMIGVYLNLEKCKEALNLFEQKSVMENNPYYGVSITNYIGTIAYMGKDAYDKNSDKCDRLIDILDKVPSNLYAYDMALNLFNSNSTPST